MWIDTHCHLDAAEFDTDRDEVVARSRAADVGMWVMPAGGLDDAESARRLAARYDAAYAIGMHPLWLDGAQADDLDRMREMVGAACADSRFVAVGEIGIDLVEGGATARQETFYREQLRIARDYDLPVIVHVRQSADLLLKYLRRIEVPGGIVHAWNGSEQQAAQLVARGFKLGFGGALTYSGSRRIRRHAAGLPDEAWVLETDAPYIPPQWLRVDGVAQRNEPAELQRIAAEFALLRDATAAELSARNRANACAALPRLAALLAARSAE